MNLYLGIDSRTQSTKVVGLDLETRRVVAEARAPYGADAHRAAITTAPKKAKPQRDKHADELI